MTHVYMCHIKKYGPIDFYFFFSILSYIEMYMIKKIFCIGDGIKSILSLKINIFIFNNILFYCTDFCVYFSPRIIILMNIFFSIYRLTLLLKKEISFKYLIRLRKIPNTEDLSMGFSCKFFFHIEM